MKCFKKLLSPSILTFEGYLFNVPRLIDGMRLRPIGSWSYPGFIFLLHLGCHGGRRQSRTASRQS